ncbi:hypothetical protein Tco_0451629 [Tanacetum coccineum]
MPILNDLITADIRDGQYYNEYLEKVAKHQRYLVGEEGSDPDSPAPKPAKATKPEATKKSKPSAPKAHHSTKTYSTKASHILLLLNNPDPNLHFAKPLGKENESWGDNEEADMQRAVEESLKDVHWAAPSRSTSTSSTLKKPNLGDVNHLQSTESGDRMIRQGAQTLDDSAESKPLHHQWIILIQANHMMKGSLQLLTLNSTENLSYQLKNKRFNEEPC